MLLLSDGKDEGAASPLEDAVAAAEDGDVVVDVVALDQTAEDRALLGQISDASGGEVVEAADPAAAASPCSPPQADALASQVLVRFPQPERAAEEVNLAVSLAADGATYDDSAFVSLAEVTDGGPSVVDVGSRTWSARAVMFVGAAALGLGLAAVLAVVLVGRRGPTARAAASSRPTSARRSPDAASRTRPSLKDSAVALTATLVKGDFETRLAQRLAGAGLALTAAEWVLLHAGIAVARRPRRAGARRRGAHGASCCVAGVAAPVGRTSGSSTRRRLAAFGAQLPETLTLMAGGLSAGLSMPQAVDTVVREGHEPMAGELRRALVEQRLGVDDRGRPRRRRRPHGERGLRLGRHGDPDPARGGWQPRRRSCTRSPTRSGSGSTSAGRSRSSARRAGCPPGSSAAIPVVMFLYMLVANRDLRPPALHRAAGLADARPRAVFLLAVGSWFMSRLVKVEV